MRDNTKLIIYKLNLDDIFFKIKANFKFCRINNIRELHYWDCVHHRKFTIV